MPETGVPVILSVVTSHKGVKESTSGSAVAATVDVAVGLDDGPTEALGDALAGVVGGGDAEQTRADA